MSEKQQTQVTSRIGEVVVYPDRARVTRTGTVELTEATTQLVFSELPLTLIADSVRVGGRGTARVRISGVDLRQSFFRETPAERARELEAEIEKLQDENRELEDQGRMLDARMKYLDGLREATREYARGLARGQTSVEEQARLLAFLQEGDEAVYTGRRELAVKQRVLLKQIQKLQQELKQIQSSRPRQRYEAVVDVTVSSPGSFTPILTYMVQRAQWQPLYDVRLVENAGSRLIKLAQLAQISQQTGEDWQGVQMTVSTARPALNQRMPEIHPWFV
ncbi:MAG: mucoidy inhibitor MuiA family protein, partial [Anaerolineales bacterium]|nr:mucoidy inhibitor MuiA family protein [Anaerolineales bacterium]